MLQRMRLGAYLLLTADGSVLLTLLAGGPQHGKWGLPGGGVEHGEALLETLARELREEVGLTLEAPVLSTTASTRVRWTRPSGEEEEVHYLGIIYRAELPRPATVRESGDGESCAQARWVPRAELGALPLAEQTRVVLREAGWL